jgi:sterol 3beta-glucosyltransferase
MSNKVKSLIMKITILTFGSRGDVQPFIPLSVGLMARGHSVKLAAPGKFKELVEEYGIPFVSLAGDPEELSRRLNDSGFNPIKLLRDIMEHAIDIGADMLHQTEEACKDADLIVHTFAHAVGAHTLAREMNIPDVHIQGFPMFTPTGDYPNVTLPDLKLRAANRLTHILTQKITWWTSAFGYEQVRRRAGLPKRRLYFPFDDDSFRHPTPVLCAWSPSVLPPSSDWKLRVHVTGYLFSNASNSYQPPVALQEFLYESETPICVSFGSMLNRDEERIDNIVCETIRKMGQRGIILSGWSKAHRSSSKDLLYLESAPHDWLLPRCKMIIHHGGAGTTSAGLRAGIPNIVIPFTADQPFWGNRVYAIGAGPKPIRVKQLSVSNLSDAITQASQNGIRQRAYAIKQALENEDGVDRSIQWIEKYSNEFYRR